MKRVFLFPMADEIKDEGTPAKYFSMLPHAVRFTEGLDAYARDLYWWLQYLASPGAILIEMQRHNGEHPLTVRALGRAQGCSNDRVMTSKKMLVDAGLITIRKETSAAGRVFDAADLADVWAENVKIMARMRTDWLAPLEASVRQTNVKGDCSPFAQRTQKAVLRTQEPEKRTERPEKPYSEETEINKEENKPAAPEVVDSPEKAAKSRVEQALFNHIARQGEQASQQLTHYQLSPAEVESAQAGVEKGIKARVTKVTEDLFATLTIAVNKAGLTLTGQDKRSKLLEIIARDLDPAALAEVVESHAKAKKAGWDKCTTYSLSEAIQAWNIGMLAEPAGIKQTPDEFEAEILAREAQTKARFAKVPQPA